MGEDSFVKKVRARTRDLQSIWSPIAVALSIFAALGSAQTFYTRTGPYFMGSGALLVLAVVVLYTVPIVSVRLFARHLVAFAIDIVTLALLTVGAVSLLYKLRFATPSAVTSMAIAWGWVLFFVVVDWRFEGSLGTVTVGLRLRGQKAAPSLISCLARNLLTLVVPFVLAGSVLSIGSLTSLKAKIEWSVALTLLFFFPLSIIFAGGQSLGDTLLRLTVIPKGGRKDQYVVRVTRKGILLTVLSASLGGTIVGFMPTLFEVGAKPGHQEPDPPVSEIHISGSEEKKLAAGLWTHLLAATPNADGFIEDVHVYSMYGSLPIPEGSNPAIANSSCETSYRSRHAYKLVRLQFDYRTPTLLVSEVFASLLNNNIQYSGRPAFLVLEISVREQFGFFWIESPQQYIVCLGGSDATPENNILDMRPSLLVQGTINEIAWLLTGEFDKYSSIEHIPIFPW